MALSIKTYYLPDTMEVQVDLELNHQVSIRVDKARFDGVGVSVAHGSRRRMFEDLTNGDFADEFRDAVQREREAVTQLAAGLATVNADRDRLARVVDKLTA